MGEEYEVTPVSFSDHFLVYFTLGSKTKHSLFKWELWKFNDKLQEDDCFLIGGCLLRQKERNKESELKRELEFLKISSDCYNPGIFYKQITAVMEKLEIIDQDRYVAAVVRARSERLWMGEAPTKRCLSDEKSYTVKKEIKQICRQNKLTRDPAK